MEKILILSEFLKTFIGLLVIINPLAVIPTYLSLTNGMGEISLKKLNKTVSKSVFIVLVIAGLIGELILKTFGISLDSFQIGGGILLSIIAYGMMNAENKQQTQTKEEEEEAIKKGESISIVPLTIPLLTGPGAMSVCVITANKYNSILGYSYIIISGIFISIIVYFILKGAIKIKEKIGKTGLNVMTKVFSLLLMALAIELIGNGLIKIFPGLGMVK